MLKRRIEALIAFSLVFIISGCATNFGAYPDFAEQRNDINKVSLLTDISVIQDINGDIHKADMVRVKEFGELIIEEISKNLSQKGYPVTESFIFSGCVLDTEGQYKVVKTIEDMELESDAIPVANPPFYIDQALDLNAEAQQNLTSLFQRLKRKLPKKEGKLNSYIHEASFLKEMTKGDTLVFILTEGRNAHIGKQIGQAVLTGLLTLGTVMAWQASTISMDLYVVSNQNGELIWENHRFVKN